jgi:hypothetical protein
VKFDNVVADIARLVGVSLSSIKPGANVRITSVDREQERIFLTDASNKNKSRPLDELRRIWECLCTEQVVHVDTVLSGSGSSRNQPETILANLPYVEWLTLSNKKHLKYVGCDSHPIGTLKQMDPVAVHQLKELLKKPELLFPNTIFVVENIKLYTTWIESLTGLASTAVSSGVYRFSQPTGEIWITTSTDLNSHVNLGCYPVIKVLTVPIGADTVSIAAHTFFKYRREDQNYLLYTL